MLVVLVGPPAVGKMTVGTELARRTGLRLFHNHHSIDLALQFFPFGSPPFKRLVGEFRRRIMDEVAESDLPGLIFTYVWAFDLRSEDAGVEALATIFSSRGGRVVYVELQATQEERLRRNETEFRLAQKPTKRDLAASRKGLLDADVQYQLHSGDRFAGRADWLRIENTALSPAEVADRIIAHFALPEASAPGADPST
ncbi:MAG TPA: AAA family ATPase [Longimicrobium sp.]|nr:AAA family ATPase [Longimicrobium sp.]